MASFWLFLTWAGWVIALGGLAGVQAAPALARAVGTATRSRLALRRPRTVRARGRASTTRRATTTGTCTSDTCTPTTPCAAPPAALRCSRCARARGVRDAARARAQDLGAGDLLRFDWFTVFLLFITLCLISAALVTRELVKARALHPRKPPGGRDACRLLQSACGLTPGARAARAGARGRGRLPRGLADAGHPVGRPHAQPHVRAAPPAPHAAAGRGLALQWGLGRVQASGVPGSGGHACCSRAWLVSAVRARHAALTPGHWRAGTCTLATGTLPARAAPLRVRGPAVRLAPHALELGAWVSLAVSTHNSAHARGRPGHRGDWRLRAAVPPGDLARRGLTPARAAAPLPASLARSEL